MCIFPRPKKKNPLEKWCMHAGKLHYKEHLVISALETNTALYLPRIIPLQNILFQPWQPKAAPERSPFLQHKGRRECMQNTAWQYLSDCNNWPSLCFSIHSAIWLRKSPPPSWLSQCSLSQAQAAQNFISGLVFPLLFSLVCRAAAGRQCQLAAGSRPVR